jgi:CubicO group peptidase (beta-lactamase class C family)
MKCILRRCFIISFVLLITFDVKAQFPLQHTQIETINRYIERTCSHHGIPGMNFILVNNDSIIISKSVGILEKGKSEKVDSKTNFRISSMSKSFTAIAVLQLVQKKLINLDDPVVKHLPFFASKDVERSNRITISQLLSHTSGIPRNAFGLQLADGTREGENLQVIQLKKISLAANPGEHFEYSDFNFYVLQALVSHCAKESFTSYMQKNVFTKMSMNRTGYYDSVKLLGNLATGHNPKKGISQPLYYTNPYTINGGDGVYTNGEDLVQYIRFLTNNGCYGNDTILSREFFDKLFQDQAKAEYGYGWCVRQKHQLLQIQHGGESPNYTSVIYIYPEKKFGFAVLCNDYDNVAYQMGKNIDRYLFDGILEEITESNKQERVKETHIVQFINFILSFLVLSFSIIYVVLMLKGKIKLVNPFPINPLNILKLVLPIGAGLLTAYIAVKKITVTSGSIYISRIYEPDIVNSVLFLLVIFNVIMLLVTLAFFTKRIKEK